MRKIILSLALVLVCALSPASDKKWNVYFTNPSGRNLRNVINPEKGLIAAIRECRESFYGAFYELSAEEVAKELIKASGKGVDVKLVVDDSNFSGKCITMILDAGIPVVTDDRAGLMHNKFAIMDRTRIFTGSYNTTDNGAHRNNNNAVMLSSPELAEIYLAEFDEMFSYGIFGNRKEMGPFAELSKTYYVNLDGMDINVYFAPEDNVERIIYNRIKKASQSVYFMYFSFTSDGIGELLIEKFRSGVKVAGLFEKRGSNSEYSEFTKMKIEGLPVMQDTNKYVMHHKVLIIDGKRVITGSYNLSRNANLKNDENILIIDSEEIAGLYMEEFKRLYPGRLKWE